MAQPGRTITGRNASDSLRRMAIRREVSNALQLPKFPALPPSVKARLFAQSQDLAKYEGDIEAWRLQVQSVLDQAIMALKLDREESTSTTVTETTTTAVPGPSGGGGSSTVDVPEPGDTVVSEVGWGQTPSAGSADTFSRSDHTHGTPAEPTFEDEDFTALIIALL